MNPTEKTYPGRLLGYLSLNLEGGNAQCISHTWYAEHNLMILDQLRPREFKGGYATTYGGCLAAPIGVLCLVVYRVDLLRRSVWSASVAGAVECWFGSRFGEARIG